MLEIYISTAKRTIKAPTIRVAEISSFFLNTKKLYHFTGLCRKIEDRNEKMCYFKASHDRGNVKNEKSGVGKIKEEFARFQTI